MNQIFLDYLNGQLAGLHSNGLYKSERIIVSKQAGEIELAAGEKVVNFCAIKQQCTTGKERRIRRWVHEHVLEAVQQRIDEYPEKMRQRRETVEHPFGTIKHWMGSTHFQMRTLKRVSTELALHVLSYNLKRVMSILGIGPLMAAMRA